MYVYKKMKSKACINDNLAAQDRMVTQQNVGWCLGI